MAAKKTATKKATTKKATTKKAAAPKAATAKKTTTAKKATTKKAAPKKAAVKVNDAQLGLLRGVEGAGDTGYSAGKGEAPKLNALVAKKLLKAGKKDKATGKAPYLLTAAGKKHLAGASTGGSSTGGNA